MTSEIPNFGLNAVAGRPPEEYGIDPTSFAEMRAGCYDVHERVARHERQRRARLDVLPVVPEFCRPAVRRRPDKDVALACSRPTTTGTSTSGAATYPGRFIPLGVAAPLGPGPDGRRGPADGGQGLPRGHLLGEPREARLPELARRPLGPVLGGLRRRGHDRLPPHRLVVRDRRSPRSTRRST